MLMPKKKIYFLCTGNSCRSQMAEGFGKKYLNDTFEVYSAGIEAHGLNPLAVKAMSEKGIDISRQRSEVIDPLLLNEADYVITLCGDANDKCPMTPTHVQRAHWGFRDPAKAEGTEEEKWQFFREVRDEIEEQIKKFTGL
jgi:arsenate reductase